MSLTGSCSNVKCAFADTKHCFENADPISSCTYFSETQEKKQERKSKSEKSFNSFWSGESFVPEKIEQISQKASPNIIGIVGTAEAGKTSYIGMLYTLLQNGHFLKDYNFAGSLTLTAWEKLAFALKFHQGNVIFPEATPSNPDFYSIYQLSLKRHSSVKEILIADASGEVFSQWGINRNDPNAGSARWIHTNANGFIFFIDCVALIEKRAEAKEKILDIGQQLKQDLNNRPVAIIWSKADRIEEVRPNIKASLIEELSQLFVGKNKEFEVSNFLTENPDLKCHENNLDAFNWILNECQKPSGLSISIEKETSSNDLFLNYRKV